MLIYKSRVFDLYTTNVGSRQVPFEYVGHRGSCAALILNPNEEIGLLPHTRPAIGKTLFELPAGTLDLELSSEDTMIQELKEEAGLCISKQQIRRLTSLYTSPGYTSELLALFLVRLRKEQASGNESLRWFSLDELGKLICKEQIVDMKTVAAISLYQALPWEENLDESA
ncbi:MAG: NUDIX hydrolase [Bdellovibrionota bacterium]